MAESRASGERVRVRVNRGLARLRKRPATLWLGLRRLWPEGLIDTALGSARKNRLGFRVRVAEAGEECAPNLEARGDQARAVSDL